MSDFNPEDVIIGDNVRRFREAYGIRRAQLAQIFHISVDAVYRIERGQTGLSSSYAYILATKLHCDMNFIYGITSEPALVDLDNMEIIPMTPAAIAGRLRVFAELLEGMTEAEK